MNEETLFDPRGAADDLFNARRSLEPCEPVAGKYEIDMLEQAYTVQEELIKRFHHAGSKAVGWKLGLTDPKAQEQMALQTPLFGRLIEGWRYDNGAAIPTDQLISPRVEGELAFFFTAAITDPEMDESTLLANIGKVMPALEICDSAFAGWPRSLFDAVADNLSSGFYVLGEPLDNMGDLDFASVTMQLYRNGERVVEGDASKCMDSPLKACLWLAREMIERGTPIQAGDLVLSGSLGPMQVVGQGDEIRLDLGSFGDLHCRFE